MKIKKWIASVIVLILIMQAINPLINIMLVKAASANIIYHGTISYGGSVVGNFTIDGEQAFCIEHVKPTPPSGTSNDGGNIYDDLRIAATLYWGWEGTNNMFTNRNQGIVVTSLVLSRIYTGDTSGQNISGYQSLYAKALAEDVPKYEMSFSKNNVTSNVVNGVQRSEPITLQADIKNMIKFNIPNEVTFYNESTGYIQTGGEVTVSGGQTFYLTAPLIYNIDYDSGNLLGSIKKYVPILYKMHNSSLQSLSKGGWFDPVQQINFNVNFWTRTKTVTINHFDRVSGALLRTDKADISIGDTATFYPRYDFTKEGNLYKVLDEPKTIVVNNDETVNFYYDPPIKIYLNHRDARIVWDKNLIEQVVTVLYPNDPYYFAHRTDLKKGKYKYRPTSSSFYSGIVGIEDISLDFFYDTPLLDIGMNTLRIYTEQAAVGLPVELYLDKEKLYTDDVADMGTGEVEVNLYDGNKLLESRKYNALNLPTKLTWTISPENLTVNEHKPYTVKFENYNSNDFEITSNKTSITTDGYTASELEISASSKDTDELTYEGVIMTEKQFAKKNMTIKKETLFIPVQKIKRMKTGYGFENGLELTYKNELYQRLSGYEAGFTFVTDNVLLDSHLDYEQDETKTYTPYENVIDYYDVENMSEEESYVKHFLSYELPHVNVERKTGALFTDAQVVNNDSRITRELRDGKNKFYLPFWLELGTYTVNQKSNGSLGVNKISVNVEQELEVFAYMYAHINSPSIDDDAILMIPIDLENPFGGKIPDGWTQSDIDWIKSRGKK